MDIKPSSCYLAVTELPALLYIYYTTYENPLFCLASKPVLRASSKIMPGAAARLIDLPDSGKRLGTVPQRNGQVGGAFFAKLHPAHLVAGKSCNGQAQGFCIEFFGFLPIRNRVGNKGNEKSTKVRYTLHGHKFHFFS